MGCRRAESPERQVGALDAVGRIADRTLDPGVARVLALQRSVGNTAVARRIAPSRPVRARKGEASEGDGPAGLVDADGASEQEEHAPHAYDNAEEERSPHAR